MKQNYGSVSFQKYNYLIHSERVQFMKSSGINFFMSELNPKKVHAFLLVWTGFSIAMTKNVEYWIKAAGENSKKMGFNEVGEKLVHHSVQESEHDLMLVDDLRVLLEKWNHLYSDTLTEKLLFSLSSPTNTKAYVQLHEEAINGEFPYSQAAIEYEIERMSVVYGPRMVENSLNTLGMDFENGITFLTHHVLADQGHTKFNIDLLERCFKSNGRVDVLVKTGQNALKIYSGFLSECIHISDKIVEGNLWKSHLTI